MSEAKQALTALWLDPVDQGPGHGLQALLRSGLDIRLPPGPRLRRQSDLEGIELLILRLDDSGRSLREHLGDWGIDAAGDLPKPVIARVSPRDIAAAVRVLDQGAAHALSADDFSLNSWRDAVERIERQCTEPAYVFVDPASEQMLGLAERVARTDVNVLLDGPTGAGKDVLARVIHDSSARAAQPFVAFNCAALPEHLIEDSLFGHERGAFTGAHRDHPGLFEQAQHGTLFLDEIGDMPLHLQAKLLRVLQERQCVRLGGTRPIRLDVRILAATHRDLIGAIREGHFREDLFFRLSTFRINVPPLAQRPGDVIPLARCFVAQINAGANRHVSLSAEAEAHLLMHAWPGNVRELQNVIQRALVLCDAELIGPEHLMFDQFIAVNPPESVSMQPPTFHWGQASLKPANNAAGRGLPTAGSTYRLADADSADSRMTMHKTESIGHALSDIPDQAVRQDDPAGHPGHQTLQSQRDVHECRTITAALASARNRNEAAELLGISPRTLRYRLARLRERGFQISPAA